MHLHGMCVCMHVRPQIDITMHLGCMPSPYICGTSMCILQSRKSGNKHQAIVHCNKRCPKHVLHSIKRPFSKRFFQKTRNSAPARGLLGRICLTRVLGFGVQLSKEVLDLLDNIFVISAENRITINQIKRHPWFVKPLPGKYAIAEKHALAEQERLDERLRSRAINTVRNAH
jgi:hypothetical protein